MSKQLRVISLFALSQVALIQSCDNNNNNQIKITENDYMTKYFEHTINLSHFTQVKQTNTYPFEGTSGNNNNISENNNSINQKNFPKKQQKLYDSLKDTIDFCHNETTNAMSEEDTMNMSEEEMKLKIKEKLENLAILGKKMDKIASLTDNTQQRSKELRADAIRYLNRNDLDNAQSTIEELRKLKFQNDTSQRSHNKAVKTLEKNFQKKQSEFQNIQNQNKNKKK